jgi:murein DD-endopeptidase MepM/ murein hydrolase activator NlpD
VKRILLATFAAIFGIPLLLVAAIAGGSTAAPTAAAGASDDEQVAAAPVELRAAFLNAARTVALPPALLVAVADVTTDFRTTPSQILTGAQQLLRADRLPGGAWDAVKALTNYPPTSTLVHDVLVLAASYGYDYHPNGPPLDAKRYVFPVAGPNSYTQGHHDYPASDIFTAIGTPVVACVRAEVLRLTRTEVGKGGITITLRGEDGWRYYYAHLSGAEPRLAPGQIVEPGQLLGASGNTGNARTTPPHLHLGISITGSAAGQIDPYPYLQVWPRLTT